MQKRCTIFIVISGVVCSLATQTTGTEFIEKNGRIAVIFPDKENLSRQFKKCVDRYGIVGDPYETQSKLIENFAGKKLYVEGVFHTYLRSKGKKKPATATENLPLKRSVFLLNPQLIKYYLQGLLNWADVYTDIKAQRVYVELIDSFCEILGENNLVVLYAQIMLPRNFLLVLNLREFFGSY